MRRVIGFGCLVALLACADDKESTQERLQGRWRAAADEGCAVGFYFDDDRFEYIYACELEDGTFGYEVWRGPIDEMSDDEFTWHPDESSCADGDDSSDTLRFEFVSGDRLRVFTPNTVLLMERIGKASGGTGTAEFGCYDDEGYFETNPVEKL
ncbi:MAG TPA: hypothetical protein VFZ61_03830 [Polyangiales bacterium]